MSETAMRRFGAGPLGRAAAFVYHLLVVEILVLLAVSPGLVAAERRLSARRASAVSAGGGLSTTS